VSESDTWTSPWSDPRQNWPGRLAWLEARPDRTPAEQREMERLRAARESGTVTVNRQTQELEK
jgi:hypothetical protein